nr:toprim domain-containing protein [Rhodovulum visakhapatnamense]
MVDRAGKPVAVHRTWLAIGRDGSWSKAPVPKPKKVLGECGGAYIPIWKGLGPRGGKAVPLSQCPPGSHVYIAEGIEDALSGAMLLPEARFLAAYSLGNMGCVPLPATVSTVTLIADQDAAPEAQHALSQAIQAHRSAGRTVRVWRNQWGGKDLNDALRAAAPERGAHELEPASGWGGHAMTFFLDPSDAAADQPPVVPEEARASTASPAGFGEVFNASRNAQKIRSDAWFYEYGLRRELAQPMWDRLDREARNRVLMRIEGPDGYWRSWDDYVREEARAAAADFPEAWSDLSLDDEPFEAEIARRRKAELDEAQAVLDRPGGGLAEFLGVGATAMTDEINLATLPFAFGGGALRVIGSEALLNGVAERCLADAVARNVLSAASSSRTRRRSSCKGTLIRMPPERLVFWPRYSTRSPLMFQGPRFTAPSHAPRRVAHPRAIQAVPRENSRSAASPLA